jgi:hypothetical protein
VLFTIRFHGFADQLLTGVPEFLVTPLMVILITVGIAVLARPLVAVVRRLPGVAPIDRYGGAVFNGAVTLLLMYWVIGGVLDFDRNIFPVLQTGLVTAREIESYREAIASNPVAKQYASDEQIRRLEQQAAQNPIPARAFQDLEGFLSFYVNDVRNPLLQSKLAPIINTLGGGLPLVGHPRPWLQPAKT